MPNVLLAEAEGRLWLVAGDEHVGDLLANTLPEGVTVEFMAVADGTAVLALWHERSADADACAQPWLINPLIGDRIRRTLGVLRRRVVFAPWSAMPDAAGLAVVADAASWVGERAGERLVLRTFVGADAVPGYADIQRVRVQLVLAALARAGVADVGEETAAAVGEADVECMDILTVAAGG